MYINSEDKVPTQRLRQIAEEVATAALAAGVPASRLVQAGPQGHGPPPTCDDIASALLGQVLVADVADAEDLHEVLVRLPGLVAARGLRLVIVDSIAALFRAEVLGVGAGGLGGAGGGYAERAQRLCKVAASLKALQAAHPACAVVLTNQVTDVIMEGSSAGGEGLVGRSGGLSSAARSLASGLGSAAGSGMSTSLCVGAGDHGASYAAFAVESNGRFVRPALGPSWDSCVTTRILLTHQRSLGPALHAPVGAHPPLPLEMGRGATRADLPLPGGDSGDSASSSVLPASASDASSSFSSSSSTSSAAPTQAPSDTAPPVAPDGSGAAGAPMAGAAGTSLPAAPQAVDVAPSAFAGGAGGDFAACSVREAHLLLSPCYPRRVCRFAVVRGGLRGVEPVLSLAPD